MEFVELNLNLKIIHNFVNKVGWLKSCSDGEECIYNKKSPMSAFRIALIPKSEKQRVLDTWNKDIGTSNMK